MKTFIDFQSLTAKQRIHNFWVFLRVSFSFLFKRKSPRLSFVDSEIILERNGVEVAALRGGHWKGGTSAGVFYLTVYGTPSYSYYDVGFRAALAEF